tara:strand:+ start:1812 stop:1991 length:180 start_codon:yes stop_codon:yes gene_type:complete
MSLEPLSVTLDAAVKMTGISRTVLYEMLARGELRRVKFGKRTLVFVEDLKAALERNVTP